MDLLKTTLIVLLFFKTIIATNFDEINQNDCEITLTKSSKRKYDDSSDFKDALFNQLYRWKKYTKNKIDSTFNFRTLQNFCDYLTTMSIDTRISKSCLADGKWSRKATYRMLTFLDYFNYVSLAGTELQPARFGFYINESQKKSLINIALVKECPLGGHQRPFVQPTFIGLEEDDNNEPSKKLKRDIIIPSKFIYFIDENDVDVTEKILNTTANEAEKNKTYNFIDELEDFFWWDSQDSMYSEWFQNL